VQNVLPNVRYESASVAAVSAPALSPASTEVRVVPAALVNANASSRAS